MSVANGIWMFGASEGLPSIAGYAVSDLIIEYDKQRRQTLNMAINPLKKDSPAYVPNERVEYFGNRYGLVDHVEGDYVIIKGGMIPIPVHRSRVKKIPKPAPPIIQAKAKKLRH